MVCQVRRRAGGCCWGDGWPPRPPAGVAARAHVHVRAAALCMGSRALDTSIVLCAQHVHACKPPAPPCLHMRTSLLISPRPPPSYHRSPRSPPHRPSPQIANYMKSQGVGKGDDITIYMPMIPEVRTVPHRSFVWPGLALGVPPTCPAAPRRLPAFAALPCARSRPACPPAARLPAHAPAPNPARPHHCSCPPSCWRARASVPCSQWCLPASLLSPWRAASPTPPPRWCARPPVPAARWPGKLSRTCSLPAQLACACCARLALIMHVEPAHACRPACLPSRPVQVVTCSAVKRGPKHIELKKIVDEVRGVALSSWHHSSLFACMAACTTCLNTHVPLRTPRLPPHLPSCPAPPLLALLQALQILDNEEEVHVPRVLVYDHKASGISREAIHTSLVEGRDVWWQVRAARKGF